MNNLSKWFVDSEVDRIYLEPDDSEDVWIDIKSRLSIGDQDRLGQLLLDVTVDTGNPEGLSRAERRRKVREGHGVNASYKPSTVAILQIAIVDWSFLDNDNNKIPVTPEMIARLRPEWANRVEEEIDQRNPLPGQTTQSSIEIPL